MFRSRALYAKTAFAVFFGTALIFAAGVSSARANVNVVDVRVQGTLPQAVSHLDKILAGNGMMVLGKIHQGKVLSMTGLRVQSDTLFVGNPNLGKKLFSVNPAAGVVLPVRVNFYVDAAGHTHAAYVPPSEVLSAFNNPKLDKMGRMLDGKLHAMVDMLAK